MRGSRLTFPKQKGLCRGYIIKTKGIYRDYIEVIEGRFRRPKYDNPYYKDPRKGAPKFWAAAINGHTTSHVSVFSSSHASNGSAYSLTYLSLWCS